MNMGVIGVEYWGVAIYSRIKNPQGVGGLYRLFQVAKPRTVCSGTGLF